MTLADILRKEQIVADLQASNRWEAIDELLDLLVHCGKIKPENREAITAVVRKRECIFRNHFWFFSHHFFCSFF